MSDNQAWAYTGAGIEPVSIYTTQDNIKVLKLDQSATLPTRAHKDDAGMDLYASEDVSYNPGQIIVIPTKIAVDIKPGHVGLVCDRSSMGKKGFKVAGGVIDAGYRGECNVVLMNLTGNHGCIRKGDKVAQMLIIPISTPNIVEVNALDVTERNNKGFGSSGR